MTEQQRASLYRLIARYKKIPRIWTCAGTLMTNFGFIVIGIEEDGYAHS